MIHTSPYTFAVVFVLASAVLALWVDARFARLAPESLRTIVVHSLLALVVTDAAAKLVAFSGEGGYVFRMCALLGVMLPALVYLFIVCVWTMKHLGSAVQGSAR